MDDTRLTEEEIILQAQRVASFLSDPVIGAVIAGLGEAAHSEFARSKGDPELLKRAYYRLEAAADLNTALVDIVEQGRLAQHRAEERLAEEKRQRGEFDAA